MRPGNDLRSRIAALSEPQGPADGYGCHECGCTWDSGPFDIPCAKHDRDRLADDVNAELLAAARGVLEAPDHAAVDRLRAVVSIADALAAVPSPGT